MSSYHGWTHAPKEQGGTDPIPAQTAATPEIPWARAYARGADVGQTDQVIATATITRIATTDQLNDYPALFDVTTGSSTAIEIFADGYYIVRMAVALTTMVNGEKIKFHLGGTTGKVPGHYAEFRSHGGVDEVGFAWPLQLAVGAILEPWVYHATGTNENIGSRMIEVAFFGSFVGAPAGAAGFFN